MGRPRGNGLVELVDERPKSGSGAWHCMDFWLFAYDEEDKSLEAAHDRLQQAKAGNCPYRDRCPRYARTIEKLGRQPRQLTIF